MLISTGVVRNAGTLSFLNTIIKSNLLKQQALKSIFVCERPRIKLSENMFSLTGLANRLITPRRGKNFSLQFLIFSETVKADSNTTRFS